MININKKILFLCHYYYPHIGGVEKHTQKLISELIKRGYNVTVYTENYSGLLPNRELFEGHTIVRENFKNNLMIPKINQIIRKLWFITNIKWLNDFDIIHCHDYFTYWYWLFPITFLMQKPIYITFHGYEGYPLSKSIIWRRRLIAKFTRGNICIGDYIAKWYGTTPNYVSLGAVKSVNIVHKANGDFRILFIGRLADDTNFLNYLNIYQIIAKEGVQAQLDVIGDGPLMEKAKLIVVNNNLNVVFYGFVENPENYIDNTNVVFASSYLAILESMIKRKLVFAYYNNPLKKDYLLSIPESNNKLLISNDEELLAKQLIKFYHSPQEYEDKIENANLWARQQTWGHLADTYETLWFHNE